MTTARSRKPAPRPVPNSVSDVIGVIENHIPSDYGSECGTIGSMILDPKCTPGVLAFLSDADAFYDERNRVVFGVILEMVASAIPIDAMTVHKELRNRGLLERAGGIEHIKELADSVPTSANAEHYAVYVREKWTKRKGISACIESLRGLYEDPADNVPVAADVCIDKAITSLMELSTTSQQRIARTLRQIMVEVNEEMESSTAPIGLPTGFTELDELTGGMHDGEMIVIAARPSVGKTSLAVNIIEHIGLYSDSNCLLFSLEQRDKELVRRMIASSAGVNSHAMRKRQLNANQLANAHNAAKEIGVDNIFIDDTPGLTLVDLFSKARRLHSRKKLSLIAIDYLQLMECPGENRQQEITKISRGIKALARELNVPVLCLSQLNRASETEKRFPRISDLRESGSIEQDADVVMLLHREAVSHRGDEAWAQANPDKLNEAIVIVAKQRNGPCDNVKLTFHAAQTRFVNYRPPGI